MEVHEKYMKEALREAAYAAAEDEVPIGAIIVCRGKIIGKGHFIGIKIHTVISRKALSRFSVFTVTRGKASFYRKMVAVARYVFT